MSTVNLIVICLSAVLGVSSVATILLTGFVKASRIAKVEEEINKLWETVRRLLTLETKIEYIEKGISRIENMLREKRDGE